MMDISHLIYLQNIQLFAFGESLLSLCETHELKLSSFSSLFEVLLVVGFTINSIDKINSIIKEYIAGSSYNLLEFDLNEEIDTVQKIIEGKRSYIRPELFVNLFHFDKEIRKISKAIEYRKSRILSNIGHAFLILGLYCFILLIAGGMEDIIKDGQAYAGFKNALFFFNFQVIIYYCYHNTYNKLNLLEGLFHHMFYLILFCFISFYFAFVLDAISINMLLLVLTTVLILMLPFMLIVLSNLRIKRANTFDNFRKEVNIVSQKLFEFEAY